MFFCCWEVRNGGMIGENGCFVRRDQALNHQEHFKVSEHLVQVKEKLYLASINPPSNA